LSFVSKIFTNFLADPASQSMIGYWHHDTDVLSVHLFATKCTVAKQYIL